jgi:tetratricopeptide (TPR) repeat protein
MMRRVGICLLLLALAFGHVYLLVDAGERRKFLPQGEKNAQVLPSAILKIASGEFDGLASDFLFFKTLSFYGQTFERQERPRVKDWEWQLIYKSLMASTDLDPYFYDPYYFGAAILSWDAQLYKEVNTLLEKGAGHRDWDWTLPYFAGFNYFYFLDDNEKAFELLKEASERPDASPALASLASRMAIRGGRTEMAILYLEGILPETTDENIKSEFEKRLKALKYIFSLEKAVSYFKLTFQRDPSTLQELVDQGIIFFLPDDPYGGEFYLADDGAVKSTSELR